MEYWMGGVVAKMTKKSICQLIDETLELTKNEDVINNLLEIKSCAERIEDRECYGTLIFKWNETLVKLQMERGEYEDGKED